ncbi:MAG: zinc protease [Cyclobacteriaceae bacterium]|jgi:zinc protease
MLNRKLAPPSFPIDHFQLPSYEQLTSSAGHDLIVCEDSKLPIVFIEFVFRSGKSCQELPGTSYYAIKMLQEGTTRFTSEQIAEKFESLGSFVEFSSSIDHTSIKLYSQKEHVAASLELLTELLLDSTFPTAEYERLQQIRAQQLQNQLAKSSQLATLKFNEALFGKEHPVGNILTVESALSLSLKDIKQFYKDKLFADAKVFVSGHVDLHILDQLSSLQDQLPTVSHVSLNHSPISQINTSIIEQQDSEQVSLRQGMFSLSKKDLAIHTLGIANTMLGGYFGSRLMKSIREEKGYTYGIYSTLVHTIDHSYWMLGSELVKEHKQDALDQIEKELEKLATVPPDVRELETMKNYLKGKLLSSVDSIFTKIGMIKGLKLYGLSDDYFEQYLQTINSIKPDDINLAVNKYLQQAEKTKVLVG